MTILKLLLTFILSFILIKFIIKYALTLGLVDIPNERSHHCKITPRGAGIGFGFAFFVGSLVLSFNQFIHYWYIYLAIFLVFVVGILDDHKDASPKAKFYVIFLSSTLLYAYDVYISSLGIYFGFELGLWYLALPFSMFAIAGFTNALNLIDGIDGLAGSISFVILTSFAIIGYQYGDDIILNLSLSMIAGVVAFLYFNFPPAKVFMGDSGSLLLGFIISVVAVLSLKYIHPISVFYLAAIPILDTLIVMIRRIRRGKSPFSPDKTHIHHILINFFGGNVKKTLLFLVLLQSMFTLLGLFLESNSKDIGSGAVSSLALVGFVGMFVIFYMIFSGMHRRQKVMEKKAKRKKN